MTVHITGSKMRERERERERRLNHPPRRRDDQNAISTTRSKRQARTLTMAKWKKKRKKKKKTEKERETSIRRHLLPLKSALLTVCPFCSCNRSLCLLCRKVLNILPWVLNTASTQPHTSTHPHTQTHTLTHSHTHTLTQTHNEQSCKVAKSPSTLLLFLLLFQAWIGRKDLPMKQ